MEKLQAEIEELWSALGILTDEIDRLKKRCNDLEQGPEVRDERAWHGAWQPWAGWCGRYER